MDEVAFCCFTLYILISCYLVVPAFFIKHKEDAPDDDYCILFAHGNAEDIGCSYRDYVMMSRTLGVNFVPYDYCGYGLNDGG